MDITCRRFWRRASRRCSVITDLKLAEIWRRKLRTPAAPFRKAMRMTIYIGGFAAMLVCLALVLAIPDLNAALSGRDADPVTTTLRAAVGPIRAAGGDCGGHGVILLVPHQPGGGNQPLVVQLWPRPHDLRRRAAQHAFRTHSSSGRCAAGGRRSAGRALRLLGLFLEEMIKTIIVFGSAGIYVAFQMIVLGALVARAKGWKPSGSVSFGRVGVAGQSGGARLWCSGHHQYGVAAHAAGSLVSQLWNDCGHGGGTGDGISLRRAVPALRALDAPEGDAHLAHLDVPLAAESSLD